MRESEISELPDNVASEQRTATGVVATKPAFPGAKPKRGTQTSYTAKQWLDRKIPPPDPLLGHLFMTGSRILFAAPTGLGKTLIGMAWAFAMALGKDFHHWKSHRPAHVLYIDGELPRDLLQERIATAFRFFDIEPTDENRPDGPYLLSHEDHLNMPPIDTPDGQKWLDEKIKTMGQLDFIVFDNLSALCSGNMKDEEGWRMLKGYARSLAKRRIGQLWIHHTGRNTTRAYGTSTREWGMETVIVGEAFGPQSAGPTLALEFTKATRRKPSNAADFAPVILTLKDAKWICSEATKADLEHVNTSEIIALKALSAAMAEIEDNVPWKLWREKMIELGISK
jgi:RecA-family ATPase